MAKCKLCKQEIKWIIIVPSGKKMPVNIETITSTGEETIVTDHRQEIIVSRGKRRVFEPNKVYAKAQPGLIGHLPHFATCTEYDRKKTPAKSKNEPPIFSYSKVGENWIQLWCEDQCFGHIEIYQKGMIFFVELIIDELQEKTKGGKAIIKTNHLKNAKAQTNLFK